MITALFGDREKNYFQELQTALEKQGVKSCIAGVDSNKSEFSKPGYVTIANIYRAKGNEAFVALTRARVWCVATGIENRIFEELRTAKEQFPYSIFPAFNKNFLKRVIDEEI